MTKIRRPWPAARFLLNLLASTPFNVAVGGNVFNENGNPSLYWSSTNTNNEK